MEKTKTNHKSELFYKMLWLLLIFSVFGLILEGLFTHFARGQWESHVNTVWGPFCIIYGAGAVGCYLCGMKLKNANPIVQFLVFCAVGDIVEYFAGWLLAWGLGMEAWNYNQSFLNIKGRICFVSTIVWGLLGLFFVKYVFPIYDNLYGKLNVNFINVVSLAMTVFMVINIAVSITAFVRWSGRHNGRPPRNRVSSYIDNKFDDDFMSAKFMEWKFLN